MKFRYYLVHKLVIHISSLQAAILDFPLSLTYLHLTNTSSLQHQWIVRIRNYGWSCWNFVPYNYSEELKLYCMLYAVHKLCLIHPVLSRHNGYLVGLGLFCFRHLVVLSYLEKVTEAFPLIPSASKMADLNVGLGSLNFTPISITRVNSGIFINSNYCCTVRKSVNFKCWAGGAS